MDDLRVPASTYRLQLSTRFTLADARSVVPYLDALGITDCYTSPLLKSASGSEHGYDICDHQLLNPELGSDQEFDALAFSLAERRMGLILDFVPNHMGLDPTANRWWRDVLENGRSSQYADYFDIDWEPITPELKNRLLLPILQSPYGEVLDRGDLQLTYAHGGLQVQYGGLLLPIEPRSSILVLRPDPTEPEPSTNTEDWQEYVAILSVLASLPPASSPEPDDRAVRQRTSQAARIRLAALVERSQVIRRHLEAAVARYNGTPGRPETFDALHELLDEQPYRLAHWRTAFDEINYRRFFDVNDLGGIRMEDPRVFSAAHTKVLQLIAEHKVTGLRIDHPDGLLDPGSYFARLQRAAADARQPPDSAAAESAHRFYIVAEKILADGETLPSHWPIAGTTGYGFLNVVNRLFVATENRESFRSLYARLTGRREPFAEVAYHGKRLVMGSSMASELAVLARALKIIAGSDRRTRDFTLTALRKVIVEVVACFPVYRTYVTTSGYSATDRETIDFAIDRARRHNPVMAPALFLFLRNVLLADESERADILASTRQFAMKFQQFSAPVQAKGVEDTSFYRYNALISLNEVGGDPSLFGHAPDEFHAGNHVRLERWPLEMLASATHDTKRGEDARARLNVLSEMPTLWRRTIAEWRKLNARRRTAVDREWAPDANDEYLFYQTLLASWPAETVDGPAPNEAPPAFVARVQAYLEKAIKEAKTHTSWVNQNTAYEDAVARFVEATLTGSGAKTFLSSFFPFMRRVATAGMVNSLAQLVLKLASPGVPDFYQGTETWQLEMADPDNRRPVDFAGRQAMLEQLMPWILCAETVRGEPGLSRRSPDDLEDHVRGLLASWTDGRIKAFVTACGLRLRKQERALFITGDYLPLTARGAAQNHLVAFTRSLDNAAIVVAVPRLVSAHVPATAGASASTDVWQDTHLVLPVHLADAVLVNVLTGARLTPALAPNGPCIPATALFRTCPVALLKTALP